MGKIFFGFVVAWAAFCAIVNFHQPSILTPSKPVDTNLKFHRIDPIPVQIPRLRNEYVYVKVTSWKDTDPVICELREEP